MLAAKRPDPGPPGLGILVWVPVRVCGEGIVVIRIGRLLSGKMVGICFTSPRRLATVCGSEQEWAVIRFWVLRELLAPLDIDVIQIDPKVALAETTGS